MEERAGTSGEVSRSSRRETPQGRLVLPQGRLIQELEERASSREVSRNYRRILAAVSNKRLILFIIFIFIGLRN